MRFNYKRELEKFQANWEKQAAVMREHGMSEEAIKALYAHDYAELKEARNHSLHRDENSCEHLSPEYLHAFARNKSALIGAGDMISSLDVLDQIENPALLEGLKALKKSDLELFLMVYAQGLTETKIAKVKGQSVANICKKLTRIKKLLKIFFEKG